jgi:dihydroorotate dehydrogenase electron transfer subunit
MAVTDQFNGALFQGMIVAQTQVGPAHYRLEVSLPEVAPDPVPGQFFSLRTSFGLDPLLRRPFSVSQYDAESRVVSLLYHVVGKGTELLATFQAGQELDLLGPQGRGFTLPQGMTRALLVAGGMGVAPFPYLAGRLGRLEPSVSQRLLLGARTGSELLALPEFDKAGCPVETATDDGTAGHHGLVTELLEARLDDDEGGSGLYLFACGPEPMLKRTAVICLERQLPLQVSLEQRMACGVGSCMGCVVGVRPDAEGPDAAFASFRRVCVDGPVFPVEDLPWHDLPSA